MLLTIQVMHVDLMLDHVLLACRYANWVRHQDLQLVWQMTNTV